MSIQLYSSPMKYKDPNTGNYTNIIGISGNPGRGIASVELNNDYTLTITFTDETSITTTSIRGNGIDTIEKTSTSGLIDTYTITDSDGGTYTFTVSNGMVPNLTIGTVAEGPVAAATITGTSENPVLNLVLPNANVPTRVSELENDAGYLTEHQDLSNYVQKTDYATSSGAGVVKVSTDYGLQMTNDGFLRTRSASQAMIKAGENNVNQIAPMFQHASTFYGLAKAAGDTTQSQSSNPVGTYTDGAKSAIQTMLDVPSNAAMQQAIDNINTMKIHICTSGEYDAQTGVPTVQNPDTQTFYLVPGGESSNLFIEWVYVNNAWERFGSADVDLSGYATKEEVPVESGTGVGSIQGKAWRFNNSIISTPTASGDGSFAIGLVTVASGNESVAQGSQTTASGYNSHAEGNMTKATGNNSHAEGQLSQSLGVVSHAEGDGTNAVGVGSHAEGSTTYANGPFSHTEGYKIIANGALEHGAGQYNVESITFPNWAANTNYESGDKVSYNGYGYQCITANNDATFKSSKWKFLTINSLYAEVIGNGTADNSRSNAYALTWTGDGKYAGDIYVHANSDSSGGTKIATVDDIAAIEVPVNDVQVNGASIVNNGVANIPVASAIQLGVMSTNNQYGIDMYGQHPCIKAAAEDKIKAGTDPWQPIVSDRLDYATFYGLAKAAGADMKNITPTTVGVYPDEQKGAIQDMLGISGLLAPIETDYLADKAYAVGDMFTNNGKLYKVISAISEGGAIVVQDDGETVSGANAIQCKLGEETIKDVQVNGVSVLDNGVANVPLASPSVNGVVSVNTGDHGLMMASNGKLQVYPANSNDIKNGNQGYRPVSPVRQHESTFYGLAKAAGDTTQSQSSNAVGTYTDEAKAAIKRMFGITQTLTVTAQTQDGVTVTGQTVTVRANDTSGNVYASSAYEGQPVSFSLPSGFQYYVSISDTLAHHFNPTTARGVITNADASVTLQYSDFSSIHTAADIKAALDANIDLTDLVGESITCTRGTDTLTWDVANYDATNKRVTLLLHDAFGSANMAFEPAQALMWCENGLVAGNYTFKWNTTQVYFTLTTAIPAGGQLRATNSAFSTYESQSATSTLETGTVSTTEISGATDLGATGSGLLNHHDRVNYGSNNYVESALFWWLNSDAPANTQRVPVTKFSRAYSYNVAGFLNGLDENFVSAIDNAVWKCSTNNVYECPASLGGATPGKQNSYTVTAKIGLASEMEVFGSYGGTADGSVVFDLYNDATADDRKKYRGTTAQVWWLRSPSWGGAHYERYVSSSGGANGNISSTSYAVVPACQISQSAVG